MRVLVTGGAGYIGSHTLVELAARGHEAMVVDSFRNSSPEALRRVERITGQAVASVEADVRDETAMRTIIAGFGPDAVIHFAGLKAVGESAEIPLCYYDVNVGGTLSLLRAMDAEGCRRVVFSSSATVYGIPRYLPFDEDHPCAPNNVYGRTKYMAEQILSDWQGAREDARVVLLRYFNPVGAHASGLIGEDPTDIPNNLMPFIAQVAVGRRDRLTIFGDDYDTPDGTGVRDYIHVTDLARAHVAALGHAASGAGRDVFNIGTGTGHSVLEMLEAFSRAAGRDIPHVITSRRSGDIARSEGDPSRAEAVLGWRAELGIDEMCASTWKWQSGNPDGFNRK